MGRYVETSEYAGYGYDTFLYYVNEVTGRCCFVDHDKLPRDAKIEYVSLGEYGEGRPEWLKKHDMEEVEADKQDRLGEYLEFVFSKENDIAWVDGLSKEEDVIDRIIRSVL